MKNTYIIIIFVILMALEAFFFISKNNKVEAPSNMNMNMAAMTPAPIPDGYNTPLPAAYANAKVKEFTVTGENFVFRPNVLSVKKGDVVKINFKNMDGFHDFLLDDFKIATHQIKTGEIDSVTFVADKVGSFEYYCSVGTHREKGMWGMLTVQ